METIDFWIILIGLISNLILGFVAISKNHPRLLNLINILLGVIIIFYLAISYYFIVQNEMKVKNEIVSFLNEQSEGYGSKTLSEINEHLRKLGYKEAKYSKAITSLLSEKVIKETSYEFYSDIQLHNTNMYKLNK